LPLVNCCGSTVLAHQLVADLWMARDRGAATQRSIDEPGVAASLPIEFTAVRVEASAPTRAASYSDADFLEVLGGCGACVGAVGFEGPLPA